MAIAPGTTSTSLLLRLKKDESEAWERFDSFYLPLAKRWCGDLQSADRDEIAQELVQRVRAAIARFDRRREGSFRTWLRTIVGNLLKDYYRTKKIEAELLDGICDHIAKPSETELSDEQRLLHRQAVQAMWEDFCPEWVRCFEGIVIYDLTAKELAEELGMSVDAVRQAKFKILKRLREEFGELLD